jgi:general secretion pathway protein N
MNRWALALVFVTGFTAALVGTVPMSLALSRAGATHVSAAAVSGSIWNGRAEAARYRDIPLGDVELSLDPLALLSGTRRVTMNGPLGRFTLVQGAARGLEAADAAIEVEHLRLAPGFSGHVRLANATVLFSDGRCLRAQGRIATDVLERAIGGPEISGVLACAGEAAVAQLEALTRDIEVHLTLRLDAQGRYQAVTHVASTNPLVRGALAIAGFTERANGFVRSDEGDLGA